MSKPMITRDTLIADALRLVPNAGAIFLRHGVDPCGRCRPMIHDLRLADALVDCHLHDLEGLVTELNRQLPSRSDSAEKSGATPLRFLSSGHRREPTR